MENKDNLIKEIKEYLEAEQEANPEVSIYDEHTDKGYLCILLSKAWRYLNNPNITNKEQSNE